MAEIFLPKEPNWLVIEYESYDEDSWVTVTVGGDTINIDVKDWPSVRDVVDKLLREHKRRF